MILEIPLQKVPNQTLSAILGGSNYELTVNERLGDMYLSVVRNGTPLIYNRICQDNNPIGQFVFVDSTGNEKPAFAGFNDRFKLVWSDELAA